MSRTYEQLHNQIVQNEIDELTREVTRLRCAIIRWAAPVAVHRSCDCKLCQSLWEIAQEENDG